MTPAPLPSYVFVVQWSLHHVGGVNRVVTELATRMQRAGTFEPIVLINDWNARTPVCEQFEGIWTVRWRIRTTGVDERWYKRVVYALWLVQFKFAFRQFCFEHRVAAINLHYPTSDAFTFQKALHQSPHRPPIMLSFHGTDLEQLQDIGPTEQARWRALLRTVHAVICCSHQLGLRVCAELGMPTRLAVVHNGADLEAMRSQPSHLPPRTGRSLLSMGKFTKIKGQDVLVQAFVMIAPEFPDLCLVFVGASGAELAHLQAMCAEAGLASRVAFFSDIPHEQVADYFRQASIFVMPSRREAFGMVLLEAGCFALPVIASRVGGMPEVIEDGVTGLLVTPDQPLELAQALRYLLKNPDQGRTLGQQLQQRVACDFTWKHAHDEYVRLVQA